MGERDHISERMTMCFLEAGTCADAPDGIVRGSSRGLCARKRRRRAPHLSARYSVSTHASSGNIVPASKTSASIKFDTGGQRKIPNA